MVQCLAQGHKRRNRESNPHSGFLTTPELKSGARDRSATAGGPSSRDGFYFWKMTVYVDLTSIVVLFITYSWLVDAFLYTPELNASLCSIM